MTLLLTLCLLAPSIFVPAHAAEFSPFAGLDELKPRHLQDFCSSSEVRKDENGHRLRECNHAVHMALEDGGDVELRWEMLADPSAILSLDTEEGVKVLRCGRGELDLQLPRSLGEHLAPGRVVVGSRFAHTCLHLEDGHLYGRVRDVRKGSETSSDSMLVRLALDELPSFAHAVPRLAFHFAYTPAEARSSQAFPEMSTDLEGNRGPAERRRLLDGPFDLLDKLKHVKGVQEDDGGFREGVASGGSFHNSGNLLNFAPKRLSNFGWNWDFLLNTTASPNYDVKLPGAEGIVKVRKPYVKMHSAIYLNFSSEFASIVAPPKVSWTLGANGHGHFQARILANMNTTSSAEVDPFAMKSFELPFMETLKAPQWFQKMDIALGSMPVSFEPGFQFKARMYHSGTFHGAMAVGGKTHGTFNPALTYDSIKGFDASMQAELHDTEVWPPFWMIFTKRFELGLIFQPSILMRGDFAGLRKSTVAIDMHPFLNLTISREEEEETPGSQEETKEGDHVHHQVAGAGASESPSVVGEAGEARVLDEDARTLTVYPVRVTCMNTTLTDKRYEVRIDTNGKTLGTKPQLPWGQVNFHDRVNDFNFGKLPKRAVIAQSIVVTVLEVDETLGTSVPVSRVLGSGQAQCSSFLEGKCSPSPTVALIKDGDAVVASVELAILWDDEPELWFASQLYGASVSFPEVALRSDMAVSAKSTREALHLRLHHAGIAYAVGLLENEHGQLASLKGDAVTRLGPSFLQNWRACQGEPGRECSPSRLELYRGEEVLAAADIPNQDWQAHMTAAAGAHKGGFLSGAATPAPILLPLRAAGNESEFPAVVRMSVELESPLSSALFLSPGAGQHVPLGLKNLTWTTGHAKEGDEANFTLTVLRQTETEARPSTALPGLQGLGLSPVVGAHHEVQLKCEHRAVGSFSAAQAPCSFQVPLDFGHHQPGERLAVLLRWTEDSTGTAHELLSPPFELTAARLWGFPSAGRRLWSRDAWNARINSHESCKERDLHFRLGAGMLVRGRLLHLGLPEQMSSLGNLDDQEPQLTTGYRQVAAMRPGKDARDFLPKELCEGGLCQGALPGCREASFEKKHWPVLTFNFNRPFHYSQKSKGKFHGLMKEAIAYAFSTLPEDLTMLANKLNNTASDMIQETTTSPTLPRAFRDPDAGRMQTVLEDPTTTPLPVELAKKPEHRHWWDKHWWKHLQRRLASQDEEEVEPQTQHHQVKVQFKKGVPYVIDRPLIEMMIQHGYFMEMDDDLSHERGPLRVTNVDVAEQQEVAVSADSKSSPPSGSSRQGCSGASVLAGSLGALALLAMATVLKRRPRTYMAAGSAEPRLIE